MLKRRDFVTVLGGAAAAWPLVARAQQPVPVIGFLGIDTADVFAARIRAFRQGLSETGYVEGRNVALAFQWAGGNNDLLPTLADELVRQRVSVLIAGGTTLAARAAKAATTTIPIVFYVGSDPVSVGLVASLARPGGNLTGVTPLANELLPKRLELLRPRRPASRYWSIDPLLLSRRLCRTPRKLLVSSCMFCAPPPNTNSMRPS